MIFDNSTNNFFLFLLLIVLISIVIKITIRFCKFKMELDYINGEIDRTDGEEQKHWKAEKRRLIIAFIFFLPIQ